MSLIIDNIIIRLESVHRLTFYLYENPLKGGRIYVHFKPVETSKYEQASNIDMYFKCPDKPGIIDQIKRDVSVIFSASGVYDLRKIVEESILNFCKREYDREVLDSARKSLEEKLGGRTPTEQEILKETEIIKFMCEPKPVG